MPINAPLDVLELPPHVGGHHVPGAELRRSMTGLEKPFGHGHMPLAYPFNQDGSNIGHGARTAAVGADALVVRHRGSYTPSAMRETPMPSIHTSLASAVPCSVGRRLPSCRIPGVRR